MLQLQNVRSMRFGTVVLVTHAPLTRYDAAFLTPAHLPDLTSEQKKIHRFTNLVELGSNLRDGRTFEIEYKQLDSA